MKSIKLLLLLTILTVWSCTTDDSTNKTTNETTVTLEVSGLSDDNLAINNYATFTATVEGYTGHIADLSYVWLLNTERGELSDGTNVLPSPTVADATIRCYGRTAGDEEISVQVLDVDNNIIATKSMGITIVSFVDPGDDLGCFDQPKLIYQYGSSSYVCNFDGSDKQYLDSEGLSNVISPNGQWIAYNKYIYDYNNGLNGYYMYIKNCESGEIIMIPDGGADYQPRFSADSQTLFFLRPEPTQPDNPNGGQRVDIGAYNIETGNFHFLTTLYQLEESVGDFTVSPSNGEIALFRKSYEYHSGGGYTVTTKLSFLNPENGFISDFTTLPVGANNYGLDWSPDNSNIIFSAYVGEESQAGIYRINLTDGSQPLLVFADISPQSLPPLQPHYYANGSRIAWSGQENGQNNINIWSIDANGNDLQQITDSTGHDNLIDVLE